MGEAHFSGRYSSIDLEQHQQTRAEQGFVCKSNVGECKHMVDVLSHYGTEKM